MLALPFVRALLKPRAPRLRVVDVLTSVANATVYTFSGVSMGDLGSVASISGDVYGTNPHSRSLGRSYIVMCVHGKDGASIFGVNSVTIGGVAGTEITDAGGTTVINATIYVWDTDSLQGITDTDVVVTWNEAVTACAIGVLSLENIGIFSGVAATASSGTGDLSINPNPGTPPNLETHAGFLLVSTCTQQTELFRVRNGAGGGVPVMILYTAATSEYGMAAAWTYAPQYAGDETSGVFPLIADWSGTADAVAAGMSFC